MNAVHPISVPTQIRLPALPATFPTTRDSLHRVAAHILGRRRYAVSGKFGLRATPGGIGTPAFGPEHEVVRITGTTLVVERAGATAHAASLELRTATLLDAASLVGVDLSHAFQVGQDTPPLADPGSLLGIDPGAAHALAEWFRYGWAVLDAALTGGKPAGCAVGHPTVAGAFRCGVRPCGNTPAPHQSGRLCG